MSSVHMIHYMVGNSSTMIVVPLTYYMLVYITPADSPGFTWDIELKILVSLE